jgi:cytochrome c-type biogenesis protein CcmH
MNYLKLFLVFLALLRCECILAIDGNIEVEKQFNSIINEVRCVTCPNQSIADSSAPVAVSMRHDIYQSLQQNKTIDEVKGYLVERYGSSVLYEPPHSLKTSILWYSPFIVLILGCCVWYYICYLKDK